MITPADVKQTASPAARSVPGLTPLHAAAAICAPAFTCACAPGDNLALHHALMLAPAGSAIVCAVDGDASAAYLGELMSTDALARGLVGLVIDGPVRDAEAVVALGWPIFHRGLEPASPGKSLPGPVGVPVTLAGVPVAPGDQVVADRDGVLIVPAADWPAVREAAEAVRAREDAIREALAAGTRLSELMGIPAPDVAGGTTA